MLDPLIDPLRDGIANKAMLELVILGVACGPLGVWVVLFGQSYSAESIAHSMLPGLVLASLASLPLGLGAAVGIAVAAAAIAAATRLRSVDSDAAVAIVVTSMVGLGALLALSPDAPLRLGELLFGDPLSVSTGDLIASALLSALILATLAAGHRTLALSAFDPQTARSLGGGNGRALALLSALVALAALIATQALGNLLVVAILIAPGAAALQLCGRVGPALLAAAGIAAASGVAGIYVSYWFDVAAGASIALAAIAAFVISVGFSWRSGGLRRGEAPTTIAS